VGQRESQDSWPVSDLGLSSLEHVELDDLLDELLVRARKITADRKRIRRLLDAVVSIGSNLDLDTILDRILTAACELLDARYAALGVIGPDQRLIAFRSLGLTPEERAKIGGPPHGHGILGLLIKEPHPIRLRDLTTHPASVGFPPNHPPMKSFVGAPVRTRDRVFGNLYLTEKQGADEFTLEDEQLLTALATAAGVAIDNARLYAEGKQRQRWLEAAAEITDVLLGEVDQTAALDLVARRAREVAEGDLAMVLLASPGQNELVVEVAAGEKVHNLVGTRLPLRDDALGKVVTERRQLIVDDVGKITSWPQAMPDGPAILVPLATVEEAHGVLLVTTPRKSMSLGFPADASMVATFAGQAALALERARAQAVQASLAVMEDRGRIASDLHDLVIQRLFATGLRLQNALNITSDPRVAELINNTVDELDATIRDIRASIFELRSVSDGNLRAEIRTVVDSARNTLGFTPQLTISGPVEQAVPSSVRPQLLAVLREALSNVARHAQATQTEVRVEVIDDALVLTVADNGRGTQGAAPRGGLRTMGERAARLGGVFEVGPGPQGGTVIRWCVPLTT